MMLLLLWKRALLLAAAALIGLYSLFTATSTESLHSLPALDRLTTLGRLKPRVAILEPTSYHSGEYAAILYCWIVGLPAARIDTSRSSCHGLPGVRTIWA